MGQFLDFARGLEAEETRVVALRALLQQAIESFAEPSAVRLDLSRDAMVCVKQAALLRALDNLLTNALRHGKSPIVLSARTKDEDLTIDVRDGGQCITPAEAQALMRPFVRGNAARTSEGTGLGLAIVEQVVKAHRGHVEFEREAAAFTARLCIPRAVVH